MKTCSKCRVEKELDEFCKNRSRKDGRHGECRSCQKEYRDLNKNRIQRYRDSHKTETRDYNREYQRRNSEDLSKKSQVYYRSRREEILEKRRQYYRDNRLKVNEQNRRYYYDNPDKFNEYSQRRRARKASLSQEDINPGDVYDRDGWICQLCLEPIWFVVKGHHPKAPSLDHIVPISDPRPDNPGHVWSNVQLAHFGCNARKGNRIDP